MEYSSHRSLRTSEAVAARKAMRDLPHMGPLLAYCERLRDEKRGQVPDFDPADAGTDARVLFLMEKPGRMTEDSAATGPIGSGFVSRDNDDGTAAAIATFMEDAGIGRNLSILWNTVPWWNDTRRITAAEHRDGVDRLAELLELLPHLRVVVGVGSRANRVREIVERRRIPFLLSAHPSPINRAARPALWNAIPRQWAKALEYLEQPAG